jgi:hypothetical protein
LARPRGIEKAQALPQVKTFCWFEAQTDKPKTRGRFDRGAGAAERIEN